MADTTQQFQHLVGKTFVDDSVAPGPQEFRKLDLPPNTRVLPPNSMMTMDYRHDRLNVHLNDRNVVTSINMG